jgi:hypothetical protein
MPANLIDDVVKNIGTAQKNDPPLAPVAPYLHGTGGLFNRRDVKTRFLVPLWLPMPV